MACNPYRARASLHFAIWYTNQIALVGLQILKQAIHPPLAILGPFSRAHGHERPWTFMEQMITKNYPFMLFIIVVYIDHVLIMGLKQLVATLMLKL